MTDWKLVEGTQSDMPLELDTSSSPTTVYQRRNIQRITKTNKTTDPITGKEKEEEYEVWQYEEKSYSLAEWKQAQEELESATTQMIMQTFSDVQLSLDIIMAGGEV